MLRILHVSDLHFQADNFDQNIVIKAFLADLRIAVSRDPIDIIICSGDLVNRGGDQTAFEDAREAFSRTHI